MDGEGDEHTPAGDHVAAVVDDAVETAEQRADNAEAAAEAITDAAVQTEVVRTVETRLGEFETWQDRVNQQLTTLQGNQEQMIGLMTSQQETMARLIPPPSPEPQPPEQPPQPSPASSIPPEPPIQAPADAVDDAPAPAASPEPPRRSKPKRRFW